MASLRRGRCHFVAEKHCALAEPPLVQQLQLSTDPGGKRMFARSDEDGDEETPKKGGGKRRSGGGKSATRRDAVTSPRQALEAIKNLSGV